VEHGSVGVWSGIAHPGGWTDVGLPDLAGLLVKVPHPDSTASTVVGAPTVSLGATGPIFVDTQGIGAGRSAFTGYFKGSFSALVSNHQIFGIQSFKRDVVHLSNGAIRINPQDSGGSEFGSTDSASGTLQTGIEYEIVVSIYLAAVFARAWVDGAQVINAFSAKSFRPETSRWSIRTVMQRSSLCLWTP